MRIALLAPFGLRAKGTARARTLPLARALVRRGHTVAVFIPPYDAPEDAGRRWLDAGVEVVHSQLPPGRQTAPWHWQLGWRLYQATVQWRPHVVHAFKPKGPSGLAATLFWTRRGERGPRLVVDSDDWEGAGGWNDNPAAGYSEGQKRFFAWQEKYGLTHADAWTVTSECLRNRAAAFGADRERIFILHNGVTIPVQRDTTADAAGVRAEAPAIASPDAPPVAVLYTRFAGVRPADVAALWGRVRAGRPDACLRVIGRGPQGEEAALADLPGIELLGWQEPEAIAAVLRRARLAIAPWADTAANRARHSAKILEIMALGAPVAAYAVGELPVTVGEGGVLAPPGDAAALAEAVLRLFADPGLAHTLGAAGRARVAARFDWNLLAGTALRAYDIT